MSIDPLPIDWLPIPLVPLWWWYGSSFLQITLIGGLTEVDGVMGNKGDELFWWFDKLKALSPLLTVFAVLLMLLWLFDEELLLLLLLLFPLLALPDDGVCLMWEDFALPLVVFVVELVVLLFDDDDVVFELFLVVDDELPEDFELFRLEDVEDCWCCACWRHFARRFLNQTWRNKKEICLLKTCSIRSFPNYTINDDFLSC